VAGKGRKNDLGKIQMFEKERRTIGEQKMTLTKGYCLYTPGRQKVQGR